MGNGWCAIFAGGGGVQAGGAIDTVGEERIGASSRLVDCLSDFGWARLVENGQGWEVLPSEAGLVSRARADVWSKERPGP